MAISRAREISSGFGRQNVLINGDFNIWQRGTSFTLTNGSAAIYTSDRWAVGGVTPGGWSITRDTDVPTGSEAPFSINVTCTTAKGSLLSTDILNITQRVEGNNYLPLFGNPQAISFWMKTNVIGSYHFNVRNEADNRSYVIPFTINIPNVWEKKQLFLTAAPDGVWTFGTGVGVRYTIVLAAGSSFHTTTPNAWVTGNKQSLASQFNLAATVGNFAKVTLAQLELGTVATKFDQRSNQQELALCQRYFEKTYNIGTDPGTATQAGSVQSHTDETVDNTIHNNGWEFAVRKRVTPTVVVYSTAITTPNRVNGSVDGDLSVASVLAGQERVVHITLTSPAPSSGSSQVWSNHYTADAEL